MEKRLDVNYTNGVIAVREKYLLKERLQRMCELSAEEAFRLLLESGFGGGAETATGVYDYEKLIAAEEEKLDAFIREYAPSKAEAAYLLSPRDFHNAKALVKAAYLNENAQRMLAGEGLIPIETIASFVKSGDFSPLATACPRLKTACEEATAALAEDASGAKVGEIFERALYLHLQDVVKRKGVLKKLLVAKADMTNILTALRLADRENAAEKYLPAGSLTAEKLETLFGDADECRAAFKKTAYAAFVDACLTAKEKGLPMTQAERILGGYDAAFFSKRKYALEKTEPFLYYVYRRRIENANVRIVFACLLAGLDEQDVKRRLRTF